MDSLSRTVQFGRPVIKKPEKCVPFRGRSEDLKQVDESGHSVDTSVNTSLIHLVHVCRFTCTASQPHSLYLGSCVNLHMYM